MPLGKKRPDRKNVVQLFPTPPKEPVPKTDRCAGCDMGTHHPGKSVKGCNCSTCGSGTGDG